MKHRATEAELRAWVIEELDHIIAEIPSTKIGERAFSTGLIARSLVERLRDLVAAYPNVQCYR